MSSNPPPSLSHPQPHSLLQTALLASKLHALDLARHPPAAAAGAESDDDEGSLVGVETPGRAHSPPPPPPAASSAGRATARGTSSVKGPAAAVGSSSTKEGGGGSTSDSPAVVAAGAGGSATTTKSQDPLRAFPNDVAIQIFARLDFRALARCARVSQRWHRSSTLNYVWYKHHQEHQFAHGEDARALVARTERAGGGLATVPKAGRWGRKDAKEDWRRAYTLLVTSHPSATLVPYDPVPSPYASSPPSPSPSDLPPVKLGPLGAPVKSKNDAREQYKELKGRKSRSKSKRGGESGGRGGPVVSFDQVEEDPYGDGRFDAPF